MTAIVRERPAKHLQALEISSLVTARWYRMRRPDATMYEPQEIIRLLKRAKIRFVLVGTHGIIGWRSTARGTQDTDVLVALNHSEKAVRVVREAFYVARSGRPGPVLIDITKDAQQSTSEFVWPDAPKLRGYRPDHRPLVYPTTGWR